MRRIQLERRTLGQQRRWTAVALLFASVAAVTPILGGGTSIWFRWVAAALTIAGTLGACRFRNTLHLPVASALGAAALLPDDASIDPAVVAAVVAVSTLLCAEAVAVARRLVTAAVVDSTRADARALATVAVGATFAVGCVGALAQLEPLGGRVLVLGLPVAALAVVAAVLGAVPLTHDVDG